MAKNYDHTLAYHGDWKKKTGKIGFRLTNDYLFRALLQRDEKTLKAVVSSFLRIDPEDIREIEVTNPIVLGENIENKEFHLDVKVIVDDKTLDLEMQVVKHPGWIERTLVYLCREFTDINHGALYSEIKSVWQLSFCGFTLFEDTPAFLSEFVLINKKDIDQIYSDKLKILNVDLTRLDLATEDDIKYGLTDWAKMFKAERWEELKMLANDNPVIDQAVSSVWYLSEDKKIRDEIWKREDNELIFRSIMMEQEKFEQTKKDLDQTQKQLEHAQKKLEQSQKKYEQSQKKYEQSQKKYEQSQKKYEQSQKKYEQSQNELIHSKEESKKQLKEKDAEILRLKKELELARKNVDRNMQEE